MNAAAQNLQAIQTALNEHKVRCGRAEVAILMNPLEVDRLGWEDFQGIPIEGDYSVGTGKVFIACEGDHEDAEAAAVGAFEVAVTVTPVPIEVES